MRVDERTREILAEPDYGPTRVLVKASRSRTQRTERDGDVMRAKKRLSTDRLVTLELRRGFAPFRIVGGSLIPVEGVPHGW